MKIPLAGIRYFYAEERIRGSCLGQQRDVSCRNSPAFGKAYPNLALSAENSTAIDGTFALQRNAPAVAPEGDDVQAQNGAREVGRGSALAKGRDFRNAI